MDAAQVHEPPQAPFHLGYRRWLDGLRGVAILMVLAFHLGYLPGGSLGVDLFFVLSGFLITTLLAEEWQRFGTISLRRFYLRRASRLLPAFLVLLLLYAGSTWLLATPEDAAKRYREIMVAAGYVANWPLLHGTSLPVLGHTWSLSVEEQFYLLWPACLVGLLRLGTPRRRILWLVGAGILASAGLRMILYHMHRTAPDKAAYILRLYMGLDTRADALLMGCLIGLLATWQLLPGSPRALRNLKVAGWAGAAALGWLAVYRCLDHSQYYHGLFTAAALMVASIIARMLLAPAGIGCWLLNLAPLVAIGRISYGLYLYHIPVREWIIYQGYDPHSATSAGLILTLTLVVALISFFLVERPFLRLKDHYFRAVAPPTAEPKLLPRRAA